MHIHFDRHPLRLGVIAIAIVLAVLRCGLGIGGSSDMRASAERAALAQARDEGCASSSTLQKRSESSTTSGYGKRKDRTNHYAFNVIGCPKIAAVDVSVTRTYGGGIRTSVDRVTRN